MLTLLPTYYLTSAEKNIDRIVICPLLVAPNNTSFIRTYRSLSRSCVSY